MNSYLQKIVRRSGTPITTDVPFNRVMPSEPVINQPSDNDFKEIIDPEEKPGNAPVYPLQQPVTYPQGMENIPTAPGEIKYPETVAQAQPEIYANNKIFPVRFIESTDAVRQQLVSTKPGEMDHSNESNTLTAEPKPGFITSTVLQETKTERVEPRANEEPTNEVPGNNQQQEILEALKKMDRMISPSLQPVAVPSPEQKFQSSPKLMIGRISVEVLAAVPVANERSSPKKRTRQAGDSLKAFSIPNKLSFGFGQQ